MRNLNSLVKDPGTHQESEEVVEKVTAAILAANPSLKLGDRLDRPIGVAKDGKLSAKIGDGGTPIEAHSIRVQWPPLPDHYKTFLQTVHGQGKTYLHPYKGIAMFGLDVNPEVGDTYSTYDQNSGKTIEHTVTQENLATVTELFNTVAYRFALS